MTKHVTIGTHNLHDTTGTATPFASVIGFTEAIPSRVKEQLDHLGYEFVSPKRQPDLVIAYDPDVVKLRSEPLYVRITEGIKRVTPNRGIFKVAFELVETGSPVDVYLEHRINAAFPPFIRGEAKFRQRQWRKQTKRALRMIRKSIKRGRLVIAFGDLNTPHGITGYQGVLKEFGGHFDRIGVHGFAAWGVELLSKVGSDHNRLRITASEKATVKALFSAVTDHAG